ncbi:MAG: RdgB/HAM1 family non-canonical purine NTP pyrophosphatase [Acidobacteria bacterium]|jgi:XTP/dITP diphosphohydrolase|nr:RdgB/HAM1 family non-canonical purine NTP pyrophosphatase [Acidobacteriota bacterium]
MELKLLTATRNKGKIKEIERLFAGSSLPVTVHSLTDFNIDTDAPETGATFLENSIEKSLFYSRMVRDIYTVADDSGLVVKALDGRPGVHSARYAAGPDQARSDEKNIEKLLLELNNIPMENRQAKFVTVITLALNGDVIKSFYGEVKGIILMEKRGTDGFGYDPVFFYPPLQKTFAELSIEEKNKISHRARAFQKLKKYITHSLGSSVPRSGLP